MINKKSAVMLACAVALAGVLLYGLPYGKVYQILSALQEQDRERLNRYIDFAELKAGLREQFRASMSIPGPAVAGDKIRQGMMLQVLDQAMEQMLTPEGAASFFRKGLSGLMENAGEPPDRPASPETYSTMKIFLALLGYADFSYASPAEFVVTYKDRQNQSLRFLLKRNGLNWRLHRIDVEGSSGEKRK